MTQRVPPKVYAIGPERPFLATLADGLLAMTGGDPMRLPRVTILLPTRRAVRALRDAFLRSAPEGREAGTPLLLPRMRPIGDLDSDELTLADGTADGGTLAVPPAIPELRRRLLLTQLVMRWGQVRGQAPLLPGQAAALAASLARFLDTVATEGANFARLADLVPQDLAAHWRIVHKFLEILPQQWPHLDTAGDRDVTATFGRPGDVARELDHVAKALIGHEQQGSTGQLRAVPLRPAGRWHQR